MRLLGSGNRKVAVVLTTLCVAAISGGALIAVATSDGTGPKAAQPVAPSPGTGLNSGSFDDLTADVPDEPGVDGRKGTDEPASADVPVDGARKGPTVIKAGAPGALNGIPRGAFPAYRAAATNLNKVRPSCGLTWPLLAGIGKVESGHASGGRVDDFGTTRGLLLGPVLNGAPGLGKVRDTDKGRLDKNRVWDRPVGPMQIIPSVWRKYAVDGNADEVRSPNNMYDATATVGVFLCGHGDDLRDPRELVRSLLRYNHSKNFVATVLRWMRIYSRSAVTVPNQAGTIPAPKVKGKGNVERKTDPRDVPEVEDPVRPTEPRPTDTSKPDPWKPTDPDDPTVTVTVPTLRPPSHSPTLTPTWPTRTPTRTPTHPPTTTPTRPPTTTPTKPPTSTPTKPPTSTPTEPPQTPTEPPHTPTDTPGDPSSTPSETPTSTPTGGAQPAFGHPPM